MSVDKPTELGVDDVKEIMEDFDDFDTETEQMSELEYSVLYAKALAAAMKEMAKMADFSATVTLESRQVIDVIDRSIRAFRMVWEKGASKMLHAQLGESFMRGVLLDSVFSEKEGG